MLCCCLSVPSAGEVLLRKQGRTEVLRKHTVPDIVFSYFMNTYGQRKVASKYVGSLINSLMLHRTQDQRLGECNRSYHCYLSYAHERVRHPSRDEELLAG